MKLDTVLFGDGKNVKPASIKFDQLLNKVFPEIEADFKKAGLPTSAGLAIKDSDARKLLATETSTPRAKDPYIQVGIWKKDLVFALFDKSNPKFDAYEVIVKGYVDVKEALAKKLRHDIDSLVDALVAGAKKSKLDGPAYLMSEQARPVLAKLKQLEGALHGVREEIDTIVKEQKRTGDVDGADVAHMKGTFGFKALQDALKLR